MRPAPLLLLAGVALGGAASPTQPILRGDVQIHDPTVLRVNGAYVAFGTGHEYIDDGTLRVKTSPDGVTWTDAGTLTQTQPAWVNGALGTNPPNLWAPNITLHGGTAYLYYAASQFGKNTSAIGLTTNKTFDPNHPTRGWTDLGIVVRSGPGDNFNAIDAARIDTPDGRAWLAFGSWWDGIKLRELDPASGKLKTRNKTLYRLASRGGQGIEAPSILQHGGYYYLFTSWDRCCAGVNSTYRIMMGRARTVTGPYTDRTGRPLTDGGGTPLLTSAGRYIGPGGQEAFHDGARDTLAYHYYDADDAGLSKLQTATLRWGADGWPTLDPHPGGS
ncbi:arabinan endo-1,5-alpha-L-arabinosidase [Deinococcus maricopensis]|uniref:Arabinan endo-1,5-alpha-L-arabinosidase n=1 Tax=Deinococcus maricopensis (strain DSM 21211 / LMG 22137 / NRRL B-23946 / LB-34) TaxID=709986 RepID=E8U475_DEIML|nr:arabinan endo-1,5-alpha-L-arabinosidase [Deinococcus maricopensis]ADV65912.1 Arabinan endo-1,5-alpha-L-arabinosidase [Deinococcus maricopensis DSM 21211]